MRRYRGLSFPRADNRKFRAWRVEGEFTGKFTKILRKEKKKKGSEIKQSVSSKFSSLYFDFPNIFRWSRRNR